MAPEDILCQVGKRIRLYRKARGLTINQLAALVHKSKSSLSKYESGQVAVDIATLFEIAQALEVNPAQLFAVKPTRKQPNSTLTGNPFAPAEQLYLYHMNRNIIHSSVLQLTPGEEPGEINATLFYKVEHIREVERCDCIYHGKMYNHQAVLSFILRNYHNPVENALMNFLLPARKITTITGLLCGLEGTTLMPAAHKIVLSITPLALSNQLLEQLTIDPAIFKEMKRKNMLYLPLSLD